MKAQVSVEYLLLFSIGLVMISFALGALDVIKDTQEQLTSYEKAKISVESIKSASDSACALGSGNSRLREFKWAVSFECDGNKVTATVGGKSAVAVLEHCEFSSCEDGKNFRIINNEFGEIELEKID